MWSWGDGGGRNNSGQCRLLAVEGVPLHPVSFPGKWDSQCVPVQATAWPTWELFSSLVEIAPVSFLFFSSVWFPNESLRVLNKCLLNSWIGEWGLVWPAGELRLEGIRKPGVFAWK